MVLSWFEKRRRQAAAAQPPVNKARAAKLPGKGNRNHWERGNPGKGRITYKTVAVDVLLTTIFVSAFILNQSTVLTARILYFGYPKSRITGYHRGS
jgi:hypothetical protein